MTAYISLVNFTEQGVRGIKETVNRAKAFEKAMESVGARKIGVWWTLGQYDMVLIAEAPDDETIARALISLGMLGNVRTVSLRAFSEVEMEKIVSGLK
jgi:uncharacterized protein with GYD domain